MFGHLFKFSLYFIGSFLILCIPFEGKPLFLHLNGHADQFYQKVSDKAQNGLHKGKEIGVKFFSNATPQDMDAVNNTQSSTMEMLPNGSPTETIDIKEAPAQEEYSEQEIQQLKTLLEKSENN